MNQVSWSRIPDGQNPTPPDETEPTWRQRATSRSLSAARSRAEQRVQRFGCGVRADRREGYDRIHDPGSRGSLEAVAAQLLPVLRRQGRAYPRPVRVSSRVPRSPAPGRRLRSEPLERLRAFTVRSTSVRAAGAARNAAYRPPPISVFSTQLALAIRARDGGDVPVARLLASCSTRGRGQRIEVADTRHAPFHPETVMWSWLGNGLIQNPGLASRPRRPGSLLHGLRG